MIMALSKIVWLREVKPKATIEEIDNVTHLEYCNLMIHVV
jgi:hypothetical protein